MKQAQVTLKMRDAETNEIVGEMSAPAVTLDDTSFIIAPGCLPGLSDAPASDVKVEIQPNVVVVPFSNKEVTTDNDTGQTILTLLSN